MAGFTVGGMAKGAAMLEPNMATMLAVLTTDAEATPVVLQQVLPDAVADTVQLHHRRRGDLDQRHRPAAGQRGGRPDRRRWRSRPP